MGWQLRHTRVPATGHATGVNVTVDMFCLLEEQGVMQKKEDRGFATWCGDLVSPGQPARAFSKPVLVQGTVLGGFLQADCGTQGGDEQGRILGELLGAGRYSAPTCGTGE